MLKQLKTLLNSAPAQSFARFQIANLLASIFVLTVLDTLQNYGLVYFLFGIKLVALLYYNEYPAKKDPFSVLFFAIACIEILLVFWTGSFSIYTYAFSML